MEPKEPPTKKKKVDPSLLVAAAAAASSGGEGTRPEGPVAVLSRDGSLSQQRQPPKDKMIDWLAIVVRFDDSLTPEPIRLQCLETLTSQMSTILAHPHHSQFIGEIVPRLLRYLERHEPHFLEESVRHQCRQRIIQMFRQFPCNDQLRKYLTVVLTAMVKVVEVDNADNAFSAIRAIIHLNLKFKPPLSQDTIKLVQFARLAYSQLAAKLKMIFQQRHTYEIKDFSEQGLKPLLDGIFTTVALQSVTGSGKKKKVNFLPKAINSLKVIQNLYLPVLTFLKMYNDSHDLLSREVVKLVTLLIQTISINPEKDSVGQGQINQVTLVEFINIQMSSVRFLSSLATGLGKLLLGQDKGDSLVQGLLNMFQNCPSGLPIQRKDLYSRAQQIANSESLSIKFAPHLDKFLNEEILVGKGWTATHYWRHFASIFAAELTHNLITHISSDTLIYSLLFFFYQLNDDSIPLASQKVAGNLSFVLLEHIINKKMIHQNLDDGVKREILFKGLEMVAFKLKTICLVHLPLYYYHCEEKSKVVVVAVEEDKRERDPCPVVEDSRALVKTLILVAKLVGRGISKEMHQPLLPKEIRVYQKLFKWGLKSVEIFGMMMRMRNIVEERSYVLEGTTIIMPFGLKLSKEEQDILEHFGTIFHTLNPYTFREIFNGSLPVYVELVEKNPAAEYLANIFLKNNGGKNQIFVTLLIQYLVKNLELLGDANNKTRGAVHLKLFRLVIRSFKFDSSPNAQIFRPYLSTVVLTSLKLAYQVKEPLNYFLLLRALFCSVQQGSYNIFVEELLPTWMEVLNKLNLLQSSAHPKEMNELFVELCLIFPVNLPNMLSHIPHLMNPIVRALNGPPLLVSHALRTLQLGVDTFDSEFFYEHIQSAYPDIFQSLWRLFLLPIDDPRHERATAAFKLLGKLGGYNRKYLMNSQKLEFLQQKSTLIGQTVLLQFPGQKRTIAFPVEKVVNFAVKTLRVSSSNEIYFTFYQKQSWEFLKNFVIASLEKGSVNRALMLHARETTVPTKWVPFTANPDFQASVNKKKCREVLVTALTGWIIATTNIANPSVIRKDAYINLTKVLRHFAVILAMPEERNHHEQPLHQAFQLGGMSRSSSSSSSSSSKDDDGLDPYVIFDAFCSALACPEMDLHRVVMFSISVVVDYAIRFLGSKKKAFSCPMMSYFLDKLCNQCSEQPWYIKLGACEAINFLLEKAPVTWSLQNQTQILNAMFIVLHDLSEELAVKCLDVAKEIIKRMIRLVSSLPTAENQEINKALKETCMRNFALEFTKRLTCPTSSVREECQSGLELMSDLLRCPTSTLILPYRDIVLEMLVPPKGLLRNHSMHHQLGFLEGSAFCLGRLQPPIFSFDVENNKAIFHELRLIIESDDSTLKRNQSYQQNRAISLIELKKSALNLLSKFVFHNISAENQHKIAEILMKNVISNQHQEIQKHSFDILKDLTITGENPVISVPAVLFDELVVPLVQSLVDGKTVSMPMLRQFFFFAQLFPNVNEDVWDSLLQSLLKLSEVYTNSYQNNPNPFGLQEFQLLTGIMDCFQSLQSPSIPSSSSPGTNKNPARFIQPLVNQCINVEKNLHLSADNPLRNSLMKYLLNHTHTFLSLVLSLPKILNSEWVQFFLYVIAHPEASTLRQKLMKDPHHLTIWLTTSCSMLADVEEKGELKKTYNLTEEEQRNLVFMAVKTVNILVQFSSPDDDETWLNSEKNVIAALKTLWYNKKYDSTCSSSSSSGILSSATSQQRDSRRKQLIAKLDSSNWEESTIVLQLLLKYFQSNRQDIELLFQMLRAFQSRPLVQTHCFQEFLEGTLKKWENSWKWRVFLEFLKVFKDTSIDEEYKARILHYVIIPCFKESFDNGTGKDHLLVGTINGKEISIWALICRVFPANRSKMFSDSLRIECYQLCILLMQNSPENFLGNGADLKDMVMMAWPCLTPKLFATMDPFVKYTGALFLSHIVSKHHRVTSISVPASTPLLKELLKTPPANIKVNDLINEALDILAPTLLKLAPKGKETLFVLTKEQLREEGRNLHALVHIVKFILRHETIFYEARDTFLSYMLAGARNIYHSASKTFSGEGAVKLMEVAVNWTLKDFNKEDTVVTSPPSTLESGLSLISELIKMACHPRPEGKCFVGLIKKLLTSNSSCQMQLKVGLWMDKTLSSNIRKIQLHHQQQQQQQQQPENNNEEEECQLVCCRGLEILTLFIERLPMERVLEIVRCSQVGLRSCLFSGRRAVLEAMQTFLEKVFITFPTDALDGGGESSKFDELDAAYFPMSKMIMDGLNRFAQANWPVTTCNNSNNIIDILNQQEATLLLLLMMGPMLMLKTTCTSNPSYLDRFLAILLKCIDKLAYAHCCKVDTTTTTTTTTKGVVVSVEELLLWSLDLVKNKTGSMSMGLRELFIGRILVNLIDKSRDKEIISKIMELLKEWLVNDNNNLIYVKKMPKVMNSLLLKLWENVKRHFSDDDYDNNSGDDKVQKMFYDLILLFYENVEVEERRELDPAFLSGFKSKNPMRRERFFEVFAKALTPRLYDRLNYIVKHQDWGMLEAHYWIKQCNQLLLSTVMGKKVFLSPGNEAYVSFPKLKNSRKYFRATLTDNNNEVEQESDDPIEKVIDDLAACNVRDEEALEEAINLLEEVFMKDGWKEILGSSEEEGSLSRKIFIENDKNQLAQDEEINNVKMNLIHPMVQLCHMDDKLAESIWLDLFPKVWEILENAQRDQLKQHFGSFLSSGVHSVQKECLPSALNTFTEGLCRCVPQIELKPNLITYLATGHNLWFRMTLLAEQLVSNATQNNNNDDDKKTNASDSDNLICELSTLYSLLNEDDLWASFWQHHAKFSDCSDAVCYEQHGLYDEAEASYRSAITKISDPMCSIPLGCGEGKLLENHWLRCTKELNQWEDIQEYCLSPAGKKPLWGLEATWRNDTWEEAKKAIYDLELGVHDEGDEWKFNLLKGYILCSDADCISTDDDNDDAQLIIKTKLDDCEKYGENAKDFCIRDIRALPLIPGTPHISLLQAAHQISEFMEAVRCRRELVFNNNNNNENSCRREKVSEAIKCWGKSAPSIADDLSVWSQILKWRSQQFRFIKDKFLSCEQTDIVEGNDEGAVAAAAAAAAAAQASSSLQQSRTSIIMSPMQITNNAAHRLCLTICRSARIARKFNLTDLATAILSTIYKIPRIPLADMVCIVKEEVKCSLHAKRNSKDSKEAIEKISNSLAALQSFSFSNLSTEMIAEVLSLEGLLFHELGMEVDAQKGFSSALTAVDSSAKAWGRWGSFLEDKFFNLLSSEENIAGNDQNVKIIQYGVGAVVSFLHASSITKENKSRKHTARLIWLLNNDDRKGTLASAVDEHIEMTTATKLVPWVPQILSLLVRRGEHSLPVNVLNHLGKYYMQAVYFPTRLTYLGLKIEEMSDNNATKLKGEKTQQQQQPTFATTTVKPTPAMLRCSQVLNNLRNLWPVTFNILEGLLLEDLSFKQHGLEELMKYVKFGLESCYELAYYEGRNDDVKNQKISQQLGGLLGKLLNVVKNWEIGNEEPHYCRQIKRQFTIDIAKLSKSPKGQSSSSSSSSSSLVAPSVQEVLQTFQKWMKILKCRVPSVVVVRNGSSSGVRAAAAGASSSSLSLQQDTRNFLLSYNSSMTSANMELFGESLIPKHGCYYVKIVKFLPRVDAVIMRNGIPGRRIYILGSNGKVYRYVVMNDYAANLDVIQREERVYQLERMLNIYMERQHGTAKRNMIFSVPTVVALSPKIRLMREEDLQEISLLEVFGKYCEEKKVDWDGPVNSYYNKIASIQATGRKVSIEALKKIFEEIKETAVPTNILKDWALSSFATPTDYWMFRKTFTMQVCMTSFAEYAFNLTAANPENMTIRPESGMMHVLTLKWNFFFDTSFDKFAAVAAPMRSIDKPVSFRLTPNMTEFISRDGVNGSVVGGLIELGRTLKYSNYRVDCIIRPILRDEMEYCLKKRWKVCRKDDDDDDESEKGEKDRNNSGGSSAFSSEEEEDKIILKMVDRATSEIMKKINEISEFSPRNSEANTIVSDAMRTENLCQMNPTWFPWL